MRFLLQVSAVLIISFSPLASLAQTDDPFAAYEAFRKQAKQGYEDFRGKVNAQYIEFVKEAWRSFNLNEPLRLPKEEKLPPVVKKEDEFKAPIDDRGVTVEQIIVPTVKDEPQPEPVEPIVAEPEDDDQFVDFDFFGLGLTARFCTKSKLHLASVNESDVAAGLKSLYNKEMDKTLADCLDLRQKYSLGDWAYVLLLKALSEKVAGAGSNESVLIMAYLYMQSGYKTRLASDERRLYFLFASKYNIYDASYFYVDGEKYYGVESLPSSIKICQASFPKERSLSLEIAVSQQFGESVSRERTVCSVMYPEMSLTFSVNTNKIEFYNSYPTASLGDDFMTRWAVYANTPMDEELKGCIYPQFKRKLEGKSSLESANMILNWIQTGFEYGYDNEIWGDDRAFFSEETLNYPFCDCEDRSILFTRLVRDLLGLDCALVYYPGHLASAVAFCEDVKGDYIEIDGRKYTVCDPTIIGCGAPVGVTMEDMDNKTATVIVLK